MTPSEAALWQRLRRGQLGVRFRRQEPIGEFIVDFVALNDKLIVEADGAGLGETSWDEYREVYLESLGYRILRFENISIAT